MGKTTNGGQIVVAVIDLSRYSDIVHLLDQQIGAAPVAMLNAQIHDLISLALGRVGLSRDDVPYYPTGDGAIVVFRTPEDASNFAEHLHRCAEEHNRTRDIELAQRHFRVGIWKGPVSESHALTESAAQGGLDHASVPVTFARRLETACRTGEVLVSSDAWAELPKKVRAQYGPEETVPGKRVEQFRAHRRKVAEPAPWERPPVTAGGKRKPSPGRPAPGNALQALPAEILLLPQSDHGKFKTYLGERLAVAKRVVMVGTGLAALGQPALAEALVARAARRECTVEICMADPFSPAVETRLIEEELGSTRPPDGRDGLVRRLEMLVHFRELHGNPESFTVRVFTHYPTFALIVVDDDYFVYPYAYALLGNYSPVLRFSGAQPAHADMITFLNEHCTRVRRCAVDAVDAIRVHSGQAPAVEKLVPLAVYFVPADGSPLYRFGSEVVGHDIRRHLLSPTRWANNLGRATEFGFHLTMADALYFLGKPEWDKAVAEVRYLARDFSEFGLSQLRVKARHPGPRAVSLEVRDPTGRLHALHHELVHRVYRRAAASDYTLRRAVPDRDVDGERAKALIRRYRAPYVLRWFKPHFTLLDKVPDAEQDAAAVNLQREYEAAGGNGSCTVTHLAVMTRVSDGRWVIHEEVKLGV